MSFLLKYKSHEILKHIVLIITNGRFNIKFAKKKKKLKTLQKSKKINLRIHS